ARAEGALRSARRAEPRPLRGARVMAASAPPRPPRSAALRPSWHDIYAKSLDCVHCGLCLPACPTYLETGREQSSPRGRIYLLRAARALRPPVPPRHLRRAHPPLLPARGERRGRVGFLTGCVMPELFPNTNAATLRVLAYNGFDVVVPPDQGCCGALQAHAGDGDTARALARRNLEAFKDLHVVITNSAGCGAALRDAGHWLSSVAGKSFAAKARDVCEWLDEAGLRAPPGRIDARVCYDD